jgi:hypothetical protein
MNFTHSSIAMLSGCIAIGSPAIVQARIYASIEQVQALLFSKERFKKNPIVITDAIQEKIRSISGVRHPFRGDRIWKTSNGSWLIVDEVLGKHEMITYALAIDPEGEILGLEIMEYVESYGYEIKDASWRKQFVGKTSKQPIKLNQDIQNISGATLSAKHVTDGVKRVMALYELVLRMQP